MLEAWSHAYQTRPKDHTLFTRMHSRLATYEYVTQPTLQLLTSVRHTGSLLVLQLIVDVLHRAQPHAILPLTRVQHLGPGLAGERALR